jgi:undecaprenyl-diphosphatase
MIENLVNLDKKIFLAINHFASSGVDPFMRFLSGPVPWIFFILGFLLVLWYTPWRKFNNKYLLIIGVLIVAYIISEQSSVHLFKNVFMRLRPCHEPSLADQVRLVANGCGGQYGFVSTHAANAFNLAILSALIIKQKWFTISVLAWAILVSYSRIYVGVHYPGDILGGALLGLLIGTVSYLAVHAIANRIGVGKNQPST